MTMDKQQERLGSGKKHAPRDNLDLDVMDALAQGYGCQYGRFKADHPLTKDANEARLSQKPKRQAQQPQQKTRTRPAYVKTCPVCLKEFTATDRRKKYCSEECKKKKENAAWARSTTK